MLVSMLTACNDISGDDIPDIRDSESTFDTSGENEEISESESDKTSDSESEPESDIESEKDSETVTDPIPEKEPEPLTSSVIIDGKINEEEYWWRSGIYDRNTTEEGEFYVIKQHTDKAHITLQTYFCYDDEYIYIAYEERANYTSEVYFDLNPGDSENRQLSIYTRFARTKGEMENARYAPQALTVYDCVDDDTDNRRELVTSDYIVDSARSWWDDGQRNVNYIELKIKRSALAEYIGEESFDKIGLRVVTLSVPPYTNGKPVSCYGNKYADTFPLCMYNDIGYHTITLGVKGDPAEAVDSRFLEEYGQKVFCIGQQTDDAPYVDGIVNTHEYSVKMETLMSEYGSFNEHTGGEWGVEWANYYISYDDECIYIAAEVKDNDHVGYAKWPGAKTRADQFCLSIGGMMETGDPVSVSSSITFRFFDVAIEGISKGYVEVQDAERDYFGDFVTGDSLRSTKFIKKCITSRDDEAGITTYEASIKWEGLKAVWPHIEDKQFELLTFGAHIQDTCSKLVVNGSMGHRTGIRYWGVNSSIADDVYAALGEKYYSYTCYGLPGIDALIPHMVYFGTRAEYLAFKAERLANIEEDAETDEPIGEAPQDVSLYVGYGRENITPEERDFPYYSIAGTADGRKIHSVRDSLYASCTAFKDAEGDIALIYTLDLHAISPDQAKEMLGAIYEATKVPMNNIILNVTHAHTAPSLSFSGINKAHYKAKLYDGIVAAGVSAIADLTPCIELYAGEIDMTGFNFVRRYITDKGSLYGVMASGNEKIIAHEHEADSSIPVAKFVRYGKKDVILVNFAAHCDTVSSKNANTISADYVSAFRRTIEKELDAYFSMQLGATGDTNPSSRMPDAEKFVGTTKYGTALAYKVIEGLDSLPQLEIKGDIESASRGVTVTVDHSTDHLYDKAMVVWDLYYSGDDKSAANAKMKEYGFVSIYEVMYIRGRARLGATEVRNTSAVSIGNIVFAAADYEMFSHNGRNIKDAGNGLFDLTFMCAYSNGMIGYIPADYAFDNGGYEVYSCVYKRGTGELIQDQIIETIKQLAAN